MADVSLKPFSRKRWLCDLDNVASDCQHADEDEQAGLIRAMYVLLDRAPKSSCLAGFARPEQDYIESRLAVECCESAALAMLGSDAGYLLSHGAGGVHLATIVLPGKHHEVIASGGTLALAVIGAMARALADGMEPLRLARRQRMAGYLQ